MRRPGRSNPARSPEAEGSTPPSSRRDRLAALLALVTFVCLGSALLLSKNTQFLMPGPLASVHGAIESCSACHANSGSGNLSWIHGLVADDRLADSKACVTCHKMPDTAFNAHGASDEVLKRSTERLIKIAAETPAPFSARAQHMAFPADDMAAHSLNCATCHQEHQGAKFDLSTISNEQCRSCHVVKFDSFDGHHPNFEAYPFKQRTRIVYDHAGHFGKHYPDVAKKDPAKSIPETCSTCHNSRDDRRVMAVAPFEQTCASCHLDQIVGKERATGPKGVAFLTLPGLDVQTLKGKNASIGEWPEDSEAELTSFMKVMISRNERGRALIKTVDGLNLQDLADASADQIKAVTELAWEIKGLFHALIAGKASDVLGDLNIVAGATLSAGLVADLTASIPRDVVASAHQQWLPNLGTEMAGRLAGSDLPFPTGKQSRAFEEDGEDERADGGAEALSAESGLDGSESPEETSDTDTSEASSGIAAEAAGSEPASRARADPQACVVSVLGQCLMFKGAGEQTDAQSSARDLPLPMQAGLRDAARAARLRGSPGKPDTANARPDGGSVVLAANAQPPSKAPDQTDDLLFPTEEELRASGIKGTGRAAPPDGSAGETDPESAGSPADSDAAEAEPQPSAAPVISIESDVDPESWAEYGGWYRQDYAIFYRPTGHKDKFIYSWLFLTGPQAPKGDTSPAAAVFDSLTGKDAQGSCTKCHSVDDIPGKGRVVNFSPASAESKRGRFTNFVHEPHFGILETRGCLTCHDLEKERPYLKSYEQGNPQNFASNFGAVEKDLCQTCHTRSMARQDCLLCHTYHVNGVVTPIMNTKLPTE